MESDVQWYWMFTSGEKLDSLRSPATLWGTMPSTVLNNGSTLVGSGWPLKPASSLVTRLTVFFSWLKRPPAVSFHWSLMSKEACRKAEYSSLVWRKSRGLTASRKKLASAARDCAVPPSAVLAAKDCASTGTTRLLVGTCR